MNNVNKLLIHGQDILPSNHTSFNLVALILLLLDITFIVFVNIFKSYFFVDFHRETASKLTNTKVAKMCFAN